MTELSNARLAAFGTAYGTVTAIVLAVFLFFAPDIEQRFFPILVDQHVTNVVRSADDRLCWEWVFRKTKRAFSRETQFAYTSQDVTVGTDPVVKIAGTDELFVRTNVIDPATVRERLCVQIPASLREVTGLVIKGHARYRSAFGWWSVIQPFPDVPVPPPLENPE